MNKIIVLLCTVFLIYSCSNQEQPTKDETADKAITENQVEENKPSNNEEEIVEVEVKTPSNEGETHLETEKEPVKTATINKENVQPKSINPDKSSKPRNPPSEMVVSSGSNNRTIEIQLPIDLDKLELMLKGKRRNIVLASSMSSRNLAKPEEDDDDGIMGFVDDNPVDTSAGNAKSIRIGAFDEVIGESRSGGAIGIAKGEAVPEYIRKPKPFIDNYTGYRIEIMTVYNKSLSLNDDLFKNFGGVTFRNKTDNSTTYYIGDFKDKIAVEDYLSKVLKDRYPGAKGVRFKNGEEVKYK